MFGKVHFSHRSRYKCDSGQRASPAPVLQLLVPLPGGGRGQLPLYFEKDSVPKQIHVCGGGAGGGFHM